MSEVFKQLGLATAGEEEEKEEVEKKNPWSNEKKCRQSFLGSLACPKRE